MNKIRNFLNVYRDDISEMERTFSVVISQNGTALVLDFSSEVWFRAFTEMMEEPHGPLDDDKELDSILRGKFSRDFLVKLADLPMETEIAAKPFRLPQQLRA